MEKSSEQISKLKAEIERLKSELDIAWSTARDEKGTNMKCSIEHTTRAWRLELIAVNSEHVSSYELLDTLLDELELINDALR